MGTCYGGARSRTFSELLCEEVSLELRWLRRSPSLLGVSREESPARKPGALDFRSPLNESFSIKRICNLKALILRSLSNRFLEF